MQIKPIADLLHDNNLRYPKLAVLQPTVTPFTALLVQPEALVKVRDDYICNANHDRARKLCTAIAREASSRSVELLVTPEYSFPWDSIEELLGSGICPSGGQLWVLGCESLSLAELDNLKARFAQWAKVLHEPLPPQAATVRYLDPLVYIFSTEQIDSGAGQTVMVVQFKTTPSGDGWGNQGSLPANAQSEACCFCRYGVSRGRHSGYRKMETYATRLSTH